jgi:NADH-quinone oxidoreductase subunit M
MAPLVVITIALGIYPKPIFDVTRVSVAHLVELHHQGVAAAQSDKLILEARR